MDFVSKSFDFKPGDRCVVIGEIGVNHNGKEDLLFKLIDAGVEAGVDILKFQRFVSEDEISQWAPSTEYQVKAGVGESQLDMAKALELSDDLLIRAFEYCKTKGVGFLCTAFDHGSVDFIADRLGCKSVKVPSPDITNRPLLEHKARKFDSLLISTGASYLNEVRDALTWVRSQGEKEIALMHCLSEYPAPMDQINLKAMETLASNFGVPTGFSDHTLGITAGIAAAALGGAMIEKHFTLDKNMEGPDHSASADIEELRALCEALKDVQSALGDGIKQPVPSEEANRPLIRKSLTCIEDDLKTGSEIKASMIAAKRPYVEGAVEPKDIKKLVGKKLVNDLTFDQPFCWKDLDLSGQFSSAGKKVLCISLGSIGKRHLQNARLMLPEAEIAVYRQYTQSTGEVPEGADSILSSIDEALAFKPDIVMVNSPASEHVKNALPFIEQGAHVFIEKPLSDSSLELESLLNASTSSFVMVAYVLRFLPALHDIKRCIESGKLGTVRTAHIQVGQYLPDWRPDTDYRTGVSAQKTLGGGALLELSHELDYAAWLFGKPDAVQCSAATLSDLEIDVEDSAHVIYEYNDAAAPKRVLIQLDFLQRAPCMRIEVVGSDATLIADLIREEAQIFAPEAPHGKPFPLTQLNSGNDLYLRQFDFFLSKAFTDYELQHPELENFEDQASLEQAATVMQLVDLAKRSSETGLRQQVSA